jgi:drug/metabolite transporter (DMT)-like permease
LNSLFGTYLGETMALSTAITWALAVILFKKSGEHVHPIALNLFKGVMAVLLLIPTIYLVGERLFFDRPWTDYALVMLSGALGIGIADTLFFKSLNLLGAGLSAVVDCLYSPFVIALSLLWIDESMTFSQLVGAAMIVSAVLSTLAEKHNGAISRANLIKGLLYGVVAMVLMAVGIVMIKPLLTDSPLFWVTEWRIVGGIAVLGLVLLFKPRRGAILRSLTVSASRKNTLVGSFIGGYVAMIMWLAGMKYIQASTASALNQTSNIWIFVFAALFLKERITPVRLIAILLGMSGVYFITFG